MLVRPDAVKVWGSTKVRRKLKWYYEVMRNVKPARFLIARVVDAGVNELSSYSLEELWDLHREVRKRFRELLDEVTRSGVGPEELKREFPEPKVSFLDIKAEITERILRNCIFCERRCGVNRYEKVGVCRLGVDSYVSSYFLHLGEEPPLVPSGTIFYGSCNFRCVFCQNYDISQVSPLSGMRVGPRELAAIQEYLRAQGARNINHVGGDPTPNIHNIIKSLKYVNVNVPQLWNSNMYLTEESMELLIDLMDIWLPDFKYGSNSCALRLSAAPRYYEVVTRNLKMVCEEGAPIIIRHLVMPNHLECCTKKVLEWIGVNCTNALVNVMDQYRPEYLVVKYPERYSDIARRLTRHEVSEARKLAEKYKLDYEEVS